MTESPPSYEGVHVLVAEDSPVQAQALRISLEAKGFRVDLAVHGAEALEMARAEPPAVVISDVEMPEMDGFQATSAIRTRESETEEHIPIVAMTAHAMKGDRERCLEAGMDEYIPKPIRARQVYEMIDLITAGKMPDVPAPAPVEVEEPAPVNVADDSPPLIWEDALEGVGGKEETLRELAALLLEEIPRLLEEMRQSMADGNAEELRRAAHTLKGSARLFAAHPTADAAQNLETIGREEHLADADDALSRLQTEVDLLVDHIRNVILA
ncbi:MAG: response regulator [Candidatus Latescibacteria bacterium]|nr:response regulator [Candidatus Latescibacterota bacterium]